MLLSRAARWLQLIAAALTSCGSNATSSDATASLPTDAGLLDARVAEEEALDSVAEAETIDSQGPLPLVVHAAEFTEESMPLHMLNSGDDLHLWQAPQGGHVVLIAAQVESLTSNAANLKVRIRRPGGIIVAEESRTVAMVPVPEDPTRMQPDIRSRSQVAHVPLCPDYDADDIVDQELEVEVQVDALYTDPPVSGKTTLHLTPSCSAVSAEDQALCRCECTGHYELGSCAPDAGSAMRGSDGG